MRLVVVGAGGRMGRMLIRAVAQAEGCTLTGAVERAGSDVLGQDAGVLAGLPALGVPVTDDPLPAFAATDGVLDFTAPAATVFHAELAAQARIVHVVGTTGLSEDDLAKLRAAAFHARIVRSGNMSLGVNLVAALVRRVAASLGPDFDIEVVEMHHRHKVDAPSGTALAMGEVIAKAIGRNLDECAVYAREGHTGPRDPNSIGFATVRGGDIVGDHTVMFAGIGERIEISHKSSSRQSYADGAVRAARFLADKPSGMFDMQDVLGLK